MTNDSLQRFIFDKAPVRGEFVRLEQSFQTIVNQHNYPEPVRKILGESLCVAALLSAIIKFEGRLTVQFRGRGKLKLLLAQCDNNFHLRGLVKTEGELSYDDLMDAFNDGILTIMLDSGPNKNRYQGIVAWRGNSLAESVEGYFKDSEQLATKLWLNVQDGIASGFLLQVVPGKHQSGMTIEEEIVQPHWRHITQLAEKIQPQDMINLEYNSLLSKLFPEEDIRVFEELPIVFQCTCSRKRGAEAIRLLGEKEANDELKNNEVIVVTCDFCSKEYVFDRVDVAALFQGKDDSLPPTNLH